MLFRSTRNDVLGNLAVLLATLGVFGTGTGWPDVIVAAIMAALALQGATLVVRQSLSELRQPVALPAELGAPTKVVSFYRHEREVLDQRLCLTGQSAAR